MPRRLLRDGRIVEDDWSYLTEAQLAEPVEATAVILTWELWSSDKARWRDRAGRLGVILPPAVSVDQVRTDLPRFSLIAAEFPSPSEGRGYTQGRLLRERCRFVGELRAIGYVRRDQLFFLARCGFNSFELPDGEFEQGLQSLTTFSAEYQPSNDFGLLSALKHR